MPKFYFSEGAKPGFNSAVIASIGAPNDISLFVWQSAPGSGDKSGIINYCFQTGAPALDICRQLSVFVNALNFLDVPAYLSGEVLKCDDGFLGVGELSKSGEKIAHTGELYFNTPESSLPVGAVNIYDLNRAIGPKFLVSAIKYSFECAFGKAVEFNPFGNLIEPAM